MDRLRLRLIDSYCATCMPAIKRELEKIAGVDWVGVNPILDVLYVDYDPDLVKAEQVLRAVKKSGYTAVRASA